MSRPPIAAEIGELASSAGESLREARLLLLEPTPQNVDRAAAAFTLAAGRIDSLHSVIAGSGCRDRAIAGTVLALRTEVSTAAILLDKAAAFHGNLLERMLSAADSIEQTPTVRRVLVEG